MQVIRAQNVNIAYYEALWKMKLLGKDVVTRNGPAKRIPGPVATVYERPQDRMLLAPIRDANPFFHIFEAIWMLAGRDDAKFVEQFNSNIGQYAENGVLQGAYGRRWRHNFGHDQIKWVIHHLEDNPASRRAVIQMYDPTLDHREGLKDIPCNTAVYFSIDQEKDALDMTVTNRSNDMVWGCYGANAVHMSMLQEFVARALGIDVGEYVQFSNDFHIYEQHFHLLENPETPENYTEDMCERFIPLTHSKHWESDLRQFGGWCANPGGVYDQPYITGVLSPMLHSWVAYKMGARLAAEEHADRIVDEAVRVACRRWLERRAWK